VENTLCFAQNDIHNQEEDKYNMKVGKDKVYETIPIPNDLVGHIENLYKNGVLIISYGRDSVDFTMWSTMSEGRGIEYSKTGETPDVWAAIEVRPLSKENWYFYVSNFEKAKERNPHLFQ
jgi:hypothetical protein